jgi:hypothetical protein
MPLLIGVIHIDDRFPPAALLLPHHHELSGGLRHLTLFIPCSGHIGPPLIGEVLGTGDFDLSGRFIGARASAAQSGSATIFTGSKRRMAHATAA